MNILVSPEMCLKGSSEKVCHKVLNTVISTGMEHILVHVIRKYLYESGTLFIVLYETAKLLLILFTLKNLDYSLLI